MRHRATQIEILRRLALAWPDAHCELEYRSDFQLLVAVVLSAQTTDVAVNKALGHLRLHFPNFGPDDLIELGEEGFLTYIRSLGLAPTKSKNVIALSRMIRDRHHGKIPRTFSGLVELPGVGRKTANVVLNVAFGESTIPVDTHVARLARRFGWVRSEERPDKIEEQLLLLIPEQYRQKAHHQLIFHGRYLCKARLPECSRCPLEDICPKVGAQASR